MDKIHNPHERKSRAYENHLNTIENEMSKRCDEKSTKIKRHENRKQIYENRMSSILAAVLEARAAGSDPAPTDELN